MNKIITVYELLGLIKDGKAPKRIIFDTTEYKYGCGYYYRTDNEVPKIFTNDYNIFMCLNEEVEIIKDYKPIIEKIDLFDDLQDILNSNNKSIILNAIHKCLTAQKYKLNEVIDYLNKKEG